MDKNLINFIVKCVEEKNDPEFQQYLKLKEIFEK